MRTVLIVLATLVLLSMHVDAQDTSFTIGIWALRLPQNPDWTQENSSLLDLGVNNIQWLTIPNQPASSETTTVRKLCDAVDGRIKATVMNSPNIGSGASIWRMILDWSVGWPPNGAELIKAYLRDIGDTYDGRQVIGDMLMAHEWSGDGQTVVINNNHVDAVNNACAFWHDSLDLPDAVKGNSIWIMPVDAFGSSNVPLSMHDFIERLDRLGVYEHNCYPFRPNIPAQYSINSDSFMAYQNCLKYVVRLNDSCYKYFVDPFNKGTRTTKWNAIIQTHQEMDVQHPGNVLVRWPTKEELYCQAWLALSRGARGIKYYLYYSDGGHNLGLVNEDRIPRDSALNHFPPPIYGDEPQYRIFDWVKELTSNLQVIGPQLARLNEQYAVSLHRIDSIPTIDPDCYIKSVLAADPAYRQYNCFELSTFRSPYYGDYFMLVNRYCQPQDTVVVNVQIRYAPQFATMDYFIVDALTNETVSPLIKRNVLATVPITLLPGRGRLLRLIPIHQVMTLADSSLYTNFKFVDITSIASSPYTIDSMRITQRYWPGMGKGNWTEVSTGWLLYQSTYIAKLIPSADNEPNVFKMQLKIDGGKYTTPEMTASIYFNDVAPHAGTVSINNGAAFTNDTLVSLSFAGADSFPGLAMKRFAEAPFDNGGGYVNLARNGTFGDTMEWTLGNAIFEDGYLHLLGSYHGGPSPWQDSSVAIQTIPGSELAAWQGRLMRLSEDMYFHNAILGGKTVTLVFEDSAAPWSQTVCNRFYENGEFNTSGWDTFTVPATARPCHLDVKYWIAGIETPPPPPPPPGGGGNTLMLDNIRLEPVVLAEPDTSGGGHDTLGYQRDLVITDGWCGGLGVADDYSLSAGDGLKTVHMQLRDLCGIISAEPGWSDNIVLDMTQPYADIVSPTSSSYINGTVNIYTHAGDANFQSWALDVKATGAPDWTTLGSGTEQRMPPLKPMVACRWNTTTVPDGQYLLRFTSIDLAANAKGDTHVVYVNNGQTMPPQAITADFVTFNCLPVDADCDQTGSIHITDTQANKIWEYSPGGDSVRCFGYRSTGQDTVGFNQPVGIAVDDSGFTWVADCYNAKVKKFTSSGTLALSFGDHGAGPGEFNQPTGIAVRGGNVFVTDKQNNRVQRFDRAGGYLGQFGQGVLLQPTGITVKAQDSDTTVTERYYVSDSKHNRIVVFDPAGIVADTIAGLGLNEPWDVAFDVRDNLFIADAHNDRIVMLDPWGGVLLAFGGTGQNPGQFRLPQGLATSPDGQYLYVVDTHNNRVQRFTMTFSTGGMNLSGGRRGPDAALPRYVFELGQSRPNPFSQRTQIKYQLPERTQVSLKIYNIGGQLVRTLVNAIQDAGTHSIDWDGREDAGSRLCQGIYLYRLQAGANIVTRKLVLLK
ncbi:T9SS type A sorting domain-containing protein [bacterium]|nr:T9SS type A sorting domain-containing protein [bacterium]